MKIKTGNQNKRRFYDGILQALTYLSSGISVLVLVALFVFIFSRGWSSINMDLLTNNYWSENYNVEPVSEVADTTFERPADLSEEAYFSEKWGVAFVDHVNAHKEEMILVEYIDENSPLYAMSDVSIRSNPQDFTMQVGMQVSRLSYTNEQGDTQLAGIGGQTAQDVAQALDQAEESNPKSVFLAGDIGHLDVHPDDRRRHSRLDHLDVLSAARFTGHRHSGRCRQCDLPERIRSQVQVQHDAAQRHRNADRRTEHRLRSDGRNGALPGDTARRCQSVTDDL